MSNAYTRSELIAAEGIIWCLEVTYAGRTFRFSTTPVVLTDADGNDLDFAGGMSMPEVDFAIGTLSGEPDYRSVPIDVVFPVDVAALVENGHVLDQSPCSLFYVLPGKDYTQRRVVVVGKATQPEYGNSIEPVSFSLEGNAYNDSASWPPSTQRVGDATFASDLFTPSYDGYDDDDEGALYPVVIGSAGHYDKPDGSGVNTTSGAPALAVITDQVSGQASVMALLICAGDVAAEQVYVFNEDGDAYSAYVHSPSTIPGTTVLSGVLRDGLQQPFSYAVLTGSNPDSVNWTTDADALAFRAVAKGPFWVGYSREASFGGALKVEGRAIEGAGDVLLYVLRQSSVAADTGRWEAVRRYLNRYKLAGYIDEVVTPWDWIADNLLPILPLSVLDGPDGLFPVLWRVDAVAAEARWSITEGPGVERVSPVEYVRRPDEQAASVTVRFALRAKKDEYRRQVTVAYTREDDASQSINMRAINAEARGGTGAIEIETDWVYDEATAWLIAHDQLRFYGQGPRRVTYRTGLEYSEANPGDIVSLTDSDLSWSARAAVLENKTFLDDGVSVDLTLILYDDPARDLVTA